MIYKYEPKPTNGELITSKHELANFKPVPKLKEGVCLEKFNHLDPITLKQSLNHVYNLINTLDKDAMTQLFSGGEGDLIDVFETLIEETSQMFNPSGGKIVTGGFGFVDKLAEATELYMQKASLAYFILTMLPEFTINWYHIEWSNLLSNYKKLSIIAPRGHGKSYFFTVAQAVWRLFRYTKQNVLKTIPEDFVLSKSGYMINNTNAIAETLMAEVKKMILDNDVLKDKLYSDSSKRFKWNNDHIETKTGGSFFIRSYGGTVRGLHKGWIVADDYLGENVMYSKSMNDQYNSFFTGGVIPTCVPGGQIIFVGTPYTQMDLFSKLKEQDAWVTAEYPAIDANGVILWEDRFDFATLMQRKSELGTTGFSREYLVRPISNESSIFPWKYLERSFLGMDTEVLVENADSLPRDFKRIAIGCDFAFSATVSADFTVYTVVGLDFEDKIWLLHQFRQKGVSYSEQIAEIERLSKSFNPTVINIESNQAQSIFYEETKKLGLPVKKHQTSANKHSIEDGVPMIAALFERGGLCFPCGNEYSKAVSNSICEEFSNFTWGNDGIVNVGEHDDQAMSFWLAVKALNDKGVETKITYLG